MSFPLKIQSVETRRNFIILVPFHVMKVTSMGLLYIDSLTSWGAISVCVGVLGKCSALGSSVLGRGGVAIKMGVTGVSNWSARVGVAQGEP